jgi:hypothetical protein
MVVFFIFLPLFIPNLLQSQAFYTVLHRLERSRLVFLENLIDDLQSSALADGHSCDCSMDGLTRDAESPGKLLVGVFKRDKGKPIAFEKVERNFSTTFPMFHW